MCAEAALAESIICWPFNSTYNLATVKAPPLNHQENREATDESLAIVLTDLGDMISQALKLQIC